MLETVANLPPGKVVPIKLMRNGTSDQFAGKNRQASETNEHNNSQLRLRSTYGYDRNPDTAALHCIHPTYGS